MVRHGLGAIGDDTYAAAVAAAAVIVNVMVSSTSRRRVGRHGRSRWRGRGRGQRRRRERVQLGSGSTVGGGDVVGLAWREQMDAQTLMLFLLARLLCSTSASATSPNGRRRHGLELLQHIGRLAQQRIRVERQRRRGATLITHQRVVRILGLFIVIVVIVAVVASNVVVCSFLVLALLVASICVPVIIVIVVVVVVFFDTLINRSVRLTVVLQLMTCRHRWRLRRRLWR